VNEQVFRYNARKDTDGGRFETVCMNTVGRRLIYKDLIAAGRLLVLLQAENVTV
jgi:hypothetical protein